VKVEGRPNTHLDCVDLIAMIGGKMILLGATQADKHQPRIATPNSRDHFIVLLRGELPERMRFGA
jgi:hypothetical protein